MTTPPSRLLAQERIESPPDVRGWSVKGVVVLVEEMRVGMDARVEEQVHQRHIRVAFGQARQGPGEELTARSEQAVRPAGDHEVLDKVLPLRGLEESRQGVDLSSVPLEPSAGIAVAGILRHGRDH